MSCKSPSTHTAAIVVLLLLSSVRVHAQCSDIYDVWNGVNVPDIISRVDSACTWERTFSQYETGDALEITAVAGDTYTFSVCGLMGGTDTEINIYRAVSGFPNVAYDDDGCGSANGESTVTWTAANSGRHYVVISLAGCINTQTSMTFSVRRSSITGDVCEEATVVSSGGTAFNTTNSCGYNMVSCATASNDLWFSYTPATGGVTEFETCGSSYDTHLSIWDACDGTELACNDDASAGSCSGTTQSYLTYPVSTSSTYYIRVSGYNTATGSGTLTITPPVGGASEGDDCTYPYSGNMCSESYTSQSTVGRGNSQSTWSCGSGSYPGEDAFYAFSTSDGDADKLRVTLDNVSDANDATVEVLLMSTGSCGEPTCDATATYTIADGTFGTGANYVDFDVTAIGSSSTYYVVIDARTDGIDAYDLQLDCYQNDVTLSTSCTVDDTNSDGVVTSWDGVIPPPDEATPETWHRVCHTIYTNGSGTEALARVEMEVSECLENITNLGPEGGDSSYYAAVGGWTVESHVGNSIEWRFEGKGSRCSAGEVEVSIDVLTDSYGNETYWELLPSGQPCGHASSIFQGGNTINIGCGDGGSVTSPAGGYADNTTINEGYWCLTQGADYDIHVVDSYGDGSPDFRVYMNQALSASFSPSGSIDSATYTFTADTLLDAGTAPDGSGAHTCNAYTFCYTAQVVAEGAPCSFTDSIVDRIRIFDERTASAGASTHSSSFLRTGGGDGVILPIELIAFEAEREGSRVRLTWSTASETASQHFALERLSPSSENWWPIGQVPAAGTSTSTRSYQFIDAEPGSGTHYYRLRAVDIDGSYSLHGPEAVTIPLPESGLVVRPNPTDGAFQVNFQASGISPTPWSLFDLQGRRVLQGQHPAGQQSLFIDASALPSGIYTLMISGQTPQRVHIR